ncbi:MerR family regulatory protein [Pedococcus dokdonensis]|uniref:MerR family regulatory protein n=1 Tax=Pedococcus dokdonensis TaxID=443156 RepID=A0A1H0NM09_9MICO|nr:MerR family transcriptional regulator [Pedococcus dokdonensis]SDO93636.1 MerR family regulatory protein [Pedococcus dokdonensis]
MSTGTTPQSMTIGAVLAALQPDFPDVTISKIRFLESEGLVTPSRTRSGYRTYSAADLDRLRYVLTAQRDHFWPLKVIADALDAMDRGLTPQRLEAGMPRPSVPAPVADPEAPSAAELTTRSTLRLTRAELTESAGLDPETVDALETFGLLHADESGHFGDAALTVAHTAAQLAAYGLEPRHLRPFRTAADREIGLVQQVVTPHRSGSGRSGRSGAAGDPTGDVLRLCIALHTALVRDGLQRG